MTGIQLVCARISAEFPWVVQAAACKSAVCMENEIQLWIAKQNFHSGVGKVKSVASLSDAHIISVQLIYTIICVVHCTTSSS